MKDDHISDFFISLLHSAIRFRILYLSLSLSPQTFSNVRKLVDMFLLFFCVEFINKRDLKVCYIWNCEIEFRFSQIYAYETSNGGISMRINLTSWMFICSGFGCCFFLLGGNLSLHKNKAIKRIKDRDSDRDREREQVEQSRKINTQHNGNEWCFLTKPFSTIEVIKPNKNSYLSWFGRQFKNLHCG